MHSTISPQNRLLYYTTCISETNGLRCLLEVRNLPWDPQNLFANSLISQNQNKSRIPLSIDGMGQIGSCVNDRRLVAGWWQLSLAPGAQIMQPPLSLGATVLVPNLLQWTLGSAGINFEQNLCPLFQKCQQKKLAVVILLVVAGKCVHDKVAEAVLPPLSH